MDLTAPPMGFGIKSKDGQKIETRAEKCNQTFYDWKIKTKWRKTCNACLANILRNI
jgi:hypothetical protein